mgnify:CR=1 FL=1
MMRKGVFGEMETYLNFINGEWVPTETGKTLRSINPANRDEVVGLIQDSNRNDLNRAVAAAKAAFKEWKNTPSAKRGEILYRAADILEDRLEEIAETMTREMGKTFVEAKGETLRGVNLLRYYAGEGLRKVGDVIPASDGKSLMFTTRVPLGVVGVITPWNFPVAIPIWKIAPALVYGNTVVLKPASETGVTAAKVVKVLEDAGLPKGVLNLVFGSGSVIGQGLAEHPDVNGVTFTGSNEVGKKVAKAALEHGAKYQLEMGGKNPVIVCEDANLDLAVELTLSGAFKSTGQKCTATSRAIIHSSVIKEFTELIVKRTKEITIGDGMKDVYMGPQVSESQMQTVLDYIEKGKQEGARLLVGGGRPEGEEYKNGFFVLPTVFDQVTPEMTIAKEEIFGPVLAIIEADSLEQALEIANDVEYGLSASIFTENIGNALAFIREIEAGMIRINGETAGVELQAPFGGMKQSSSYSREQGTAAIEFYTQIQTIAINE